MKSKKIKFLISYLKYEKTLLFFGIIFTIISAISSIYLPIIIANIINTDFYKVENLQIFVLENALIYIVVSIVFFIFKILYRIFFSKLSINISKRIQLDAITKLQNFEMKYFTSAKSGDISSRFTSDTDTLKLLYETTFSEIFNIVINLIFILIVIFTKNIFLFLIVLFYFPIIYFSSKYYGHKISKIQKNIRKHEGNTSAIFNETVKSIDIINIFSNEETLKEKFKKENEIVKKDYIKRATFNATFAMNFSRIVLNLSNVVLIIVFAILKQKHILYDVGILYLVINYNQKISSLYGQFQFQVNSYKTSFVSCDRILNIFSTKEELSGDKKINLLGNVEFKEVSFEYKENTPVLKNISFKLKNGKSIAFVGSTGSGKSTIMNLILGFYDNQKGKILFDDVDLKTLDKRHIRKQMSVVLQTPYIFTGTVFENISMNDENITRKNVIDALIKVGGENLLKKNKNFLSMNLNKDVNNLSVGEKQIICFARALVRNPKILILDEATSNIDTETEKIISFGIEKIKENRSTIIVAHRLSTIKNCDIIIMLENGKIIESGSHDELIKLNGKYKKFYEIQSSKEEN